jgi:hypothetical protein
MIAGDAPFKGATPQATLMRRFMGPPRPLRPMANISEAVEAAIMRSVAREPDERFATAGQFADALAGKAVPPAQASAPTVGQEAGTPAKKGCAGVVLFALALASVLGRALLG